MAGVRVAAGIVLATGGVSPGWLAVLAAVATVGAALLATVGGYVFRRREYIRDRRLDAYRELLAGFLDAARTGADWQSVFLHTGWPDQFGRTEHPRLDDDYVERLLLDYTQAAERATDSRRTFEVAGCGADLVASPATRAEVQRLRDWLEDVLYSGSPWRRGVDPPELSPNRHLNPVDVEPQAREAVRSFIDQTGADLWGGWRIRGRWIGARADQPTS